MDNRELLGVLCRYSKEPLLIQQYADGEEFGADIYVDLISKKPVAIFTKKKVRMRAGETEKSISVKDPALFELIEKTVSALSLAGPIDMDIFRIDGKYYISEINPRFGGGYPHAWHCNVKFPELIAKNLLGEENEPQKIQYEEGFTYVDTEGSDLSKVEEITEIPDEVKAPVKKGETVGRICYRISGKEIGSVNLIASTPVEKADFGDYLKKIWKKLL